MKKILLTDDDTDLLLNLKDLLQYKQAEVFLASNRAEAYTQISIVKPDLFILDINMEGEFTGLELAMEFRQDKYLKNIPVIIMSGTEITSGNKALVELAIKNKNDKRFKNLKTT